MERLLAAVRRRSRAPILALGSEQMPISEVRTLGCDCYLLDAVAPSMVADEAARLIRRADALATTVAVRRWGPLRLDPGRREAGWCGRPLDLTPIQFTILLTLVDADGAVVTAPELARRIWGREPREDTERVVAHIRRIRKRIEQDPANPTFLVTVRGVGFRLADTTTHGTALPSLAPGSRPAAPGGGAGRP